MFSSKYIFEAKRTKYFRYFRNASFIGFILFIIYCFFALAFITLSYEINDDTHNAFYNRAPDLIVVLTGDRGRIPLAIEKAKEYKQSHIFITGVYSKNSVNTLLPLQEAGSLNANLFEIDYSAKNTFENVLETLRYLRSSQGHSNILVITSDYHLIRTKMIFNTIKRKSDKYNFFFLGDKVDYKKQANIKKVFKEVYKSIRTFFFLKVWELR